MPKFHGTRPRTHLQTVACKPSVLLSWAAEISASGRHGVRNSEGHREVCQECTLVLDKIPLGLRGLFNGLYPS